MRCHSSSTALGTRTGYWKPTRGGTDEIPSWREPTRSEFEWTRSELWIRYHLRFFDCLAHPNLSVTLATDQKWPLSHLPISYKSLA